MISAQENDAVGHLVFNAVTKFKGRSRLDHSGSTQMIQVGIESNLAQRDDYFEILQ